MKMPWSREAVRILPANIDLTGQPWCREALLLHVRGTGVLRWERRLLPANADPYETPLCLTLRGAPLLSWRAAVCETSESWLCTGWGLDTAECPELDALREVLNGGFARLEDAVPSLSPLLELLPKGVYVLAESDAYPADGCGQFFWNVSDCLEPSPATGLVCLADDDYDYKYERIPPKFLYPSQRRSQLDMGRVDYYKERLQQDGPPPHGLAVYVTEGMSVLLDGHHKAAAAALLGRTLPCLTVLRLEHYQLRPLAESRSWERKAACFGPFTVPIVDMNGIDLSKEPWKLTENSAPLPEGRLADIELPEALLAAGKRYPTAEGYALVSAAKIGYPTDRELETWLANPGRYRPQLRGALVVLRDRGDFRLKDTALRCAAVGDAHCSLKAEAFQVLAELKGDPDVEAFFIDYFVRLEEPPGIHGSAQNDLTQIAHSFWD